MMRLLPFPQTRRKNENDFLLCDIYILAYMVRYINLYA